MRQSGCPVFLMPQYALTGHIDNNIPSAELKDYFTCPCEATDYKNAIERAVGVAEERNAAVLICGSLYLASAVRREFISFDKGRL